MKTLKKVLPPMMDEAPLEESPTVMYPMIYVDAEQMPDIKDMKIGQTFEAKVVMRLKSVHEYGKSESAKQVSADLELHSYDITKNDAEKNLD